MAAGHQSCLALTLMSAAERVEAPRLPHAPVAVNGPEQDRKRFAKLSRREGRLHGLGARGATALAAGQLLLGWHGQLVLQSVGPTAEQPAAHLCMQMTRG